VLDYNNPALPTITVPMFKSPTGALGPRIIRFNIAYWFGSNHATDVYNFAGLACGLASGLLTASGGTIEFPNDDEIRYSEARESPLVMRRTFVV
jgi:hypothetical protein